MISRRGFLLALGLGAFASSPASFAQQPKLVRIGLIDSAPGSPAWREALSSGLRKLGYVEGRNLVIEQRWAEAGKYDTLPALAADLLRLKVDVFVAGGSQAIGAVQRSTTTVPIVMVRTGDPVKSGFIASLSRPGGNITGVTNANVDLGSKYLELLQAAVPKISRVAVLVNPDNPSHADRLKRVVDSERKGGVSLSALQASTAAEIEAAFGTMKQERAGALMVLADSFFFARGRQIAELAARHRVPAIFWTREIVDVGGLMSYGQNNEEHYYRAATFVDKIMKGVPPTELPVEQPTKIELVINLKAAKALGLAIPGDLLLRADKVIQ